MPDGSSTVGATSQKVIDSVKRGCDFGSGLVRHCESSIRVQVELAKVHLPRRGPRGGRRPFTNDLPILDLHFADASPRFGFV